jgi:hypothetical protein
MANDVPATRKPLSKKQQNAAEILTRYLKDAHINLHGPNSWLSSDDDNVRRIIEDLTDTTELSKAVVQRIWARVRRF